MKKPTLEDFGLTSQQYTALSAERTRLNKAIGRLPMHGRWLNSLFEILFTCLVGGWIFGIYAWCAGLIVGMILEKVTGRNIVFVFSIAACIIIVSVYFIVVFKEHYTANRKRRNYRRQLANPQHLRAEQYENAIRRYERTQESYWKFLKGTKFERALARLYKKIGYVVSQTKGSGDEGIDLILVKEGVRTVVQCKGHAKPIGVSAVRDLYGAMMHFGAKNAVLACPAGFTKGVIEFVKGKPIQLLAASELVELAESICQEE